MDGDIFGNIFGRLLVRLAVLRRNILNTAPWQVMRLREQESKFEHLESTLLNIELALARYNNDERRRLIEQNVVRLELIRNYMSGITAILEERKWLSYRVQEISFVLHTFDIFSRILRFFGFPPLLLPAPIPANV